MQVLDVSKDEGWVQKKQWKAHKDPVVRLTVDPASLWIVRPSFPFPLPFPPFHLIRFHSYPSSALRADPLVGRAGRDFASRKRFLRHGLLVGWHTPRRLARFVLSSASSPSPSHLYLFGSSPADEEMHLRQPDYCTYRTLRSLSISWNADSSRPSDLHGTVDNIEFLQQAITSVETPDIISFGFQEMVRLQFPSHFVPPVKLTFVFT